MIFISYSVINIKRDRQSCSAERSQQPSEERDTNIGMVFNFYNCLKKITLNHSGCWQILKARNFERTEVPYPKNHKNLKIVCRTFGGG